MDHGADPSYIVPSSGPGPELGSNSPSEQVRFSSPTVEVLGRPVNPSILDWHNKRTCKDRWSCKLGSAKTGMFGIHR